MASGKFDKRVSVETYGVTQNDMNEDVKAWTEDKKLWAAISYGSGAERRVGAAQEQSSHLATVELRKSDYSSTIKPSTHRLAFNGNQWDIESAAPGKDRNREIILTVRARIN